MLPISKYLSEKFVSVILPNYFHNLKTEETKRSYMLVFNAFADYIKKDILDASPEDCVHFLDHIQSLKSLKESTKIKKRKQLSSLYTYLQENVEIYEINNFENIFTEQDPVQIKEGIHLNDIPTITEIDKLIGYLKKNDRFTLCSVLFAFRTFLSTEEIRNLTVSNIFETKDSKFCVAVKNIRNDDIRYNTIPKDMAKIINQYIDNLPDIQEESFEHRKLFADISGKVPPQKTFRNRLKKAWKTAGIERSYTFNNLRNAGIVYAVSNKADVMDIAAALGYQQVSHIRRLESLSVRLNTATEYINIHIQE